MHRTLAGVIGALGLLTNSAQAAMAPPLTANDATQVGSYSAPAEPGPDATALLKASYATPAGIGQTGADGRTNVQWWYYRRDPYPRPYYYHHHHHYRPHYYDDYRYRPYRYRRHPHRQ
jgi:hypothetical protein